jgi:Fe-S cluster assembly iron-binding protein IscA
MKGVTDKAAERLVAILDEANAPGDQCVRIIVVDGEGRLRIDTQCPSDQVFERQNRKVLILDPATAGYFAESTLDYSGRRFNLVEDGASWAVLEMQDTRLLGAAGRVDAPADVDAAKAAVKQGPGQSV